MTPAPDAESHTPGFGVLGPVRVVIDGVAQPLGGSKPAAVLARLIIQRNQVVSAEALADAAWNGNPPAGFRNHLQVAIAKLRRALQGASADPMTIIATASPGYRLHVSDPQCDVALFTAHKSAGHISAAAGRFEDASAQFTTALAQWKGPALADLRGLRFADDYATALEDERLATKLQELSR